jgi:hypothetical protein
MTPVKKHIKPKRKKVVKTTFSMKSYWAPTPKKIRKIGDTLLGVFSITSMSSMIYDVKGLALASLIMGVVGKILTNFFCEEPVYVQEGEAESQMD